MGVLERITELRRNGLGEEEIVNNLREQGITPKQITDALNQLKIKSAVSSENSFSDNSLKGMQPSVMGPDTSDDVPERLPTEGDVPEEAFSPPKNMNQRIPLQQKSLVKEINENGQHQEDYQNQQQESFQQQVPNQSFSQQEYQEQPPSNYEQPYQQEQYSSYEYSPQDYGYSESSSDVDTIIEISERVFSEKIKTIQRQMSELNELKVITNVKMEDVSERLKRIEKTIDRLQIEILQKVGLYGSDINLIKKEVSMVQDSFGKVINGILDIAESKKKISKKK